MLDGHPNVPTEIHHLNDRGRNISQRHTVGLCEWHHRGVPRCGCTSPQMREIAGPSYACDRFEFVQRYGNDEELLRKQNVLVNAYMQCVL